VGVLFFERVGTLGGHGKTRNGVSPSLGLFFSLALCLSLLPHPDLLLLLLLLPSHITALGGVNNMELAIYLGV
jgi:hypothetical protein